MLLLLSGRYLTFISDLVPLLLVGVQVLLYALHECRITQNVG